MEWESVTVKGNQYIKIESVTVIIPLLGSSEEIKFKSKDAELIHIAINGSAISSDWEFSKWVEQLRKVLLQKKMPTTAKCLFEEWNCYSISFEICDFKECSISEREGYIYAQRDKQFEFENGNTAYANKKYSYLTANSADALKPYITAVL